MRFSNQSKSFASPKIWEILPNETKDSETLQIFKAEEKDDF